MSVLSNRLSHAKYVLAALLLVAAVITGAAHVYASKTDLVTIAAHAQKKDPTIIINQGTAEVVDVGGHAADIMVADPTIVNVTALQADKVYIVGMALGSTNMIIVDEQGNVLKRMNVHVTMDTENLQRTVDELFPDEDIAVKAIRGQVILKGSVSTPDVAQNVQNVVTHYMAEIEGKDANADQIVVNLMTVKGKAQVMLKVKVMEVARTLLRERGTDTTITDIGKALGEDVQNSSGLSGVFADTLSSGTTQTPFAAFGLLEKLGAFGPIDSVVSLLEDNGLAKILAEPNLSAITGEKADFLAGGEFPVPSGRDTNGNIIISYRSFGVSLSFVPEVLSQNRIVLRFDTEVSSLSRTNQVTLANIEVPGLDIRRASTTVEMASGTSLMIAGLLQSQTVKSLSGLPGITRTPILGDLFSSDSFQRQESELVVIVTPYLVEPYADRTQAKKVTKQETQENGLADAFEQNIMRTYGGLKVSSSLFKGDADYGYIID